MRKSAALLAWLFTLGLLTEASALVIQIDYSYDAATDNFFANNAAARAALEKARDDVQAAITTVLAPVTSDVVSYSSGSTSGSYDFGLEFTNPSTGAKVQVANSTLAADTFYLYVGMRKLTGTTLGQGGAGSLVASVEGSSSNVAEWPTIVSTLNAQASDQLRRGGGPIINTWEVEATLGGVTAEVSVEYGAATGSLCFDIDADDNGTADSTLALEDYWHFDHTTPVAPGKNDFYSVAMHEILHSLGFGTSLSWDVLRSGTDWTGTNVIDLVGNGTGVVDGGGGHIASSLTSPRLSDGVLQTPLMTPSILQGTRKELTELDLAFLRDIGWSTVPEPSTTAALLLSLAALLQLRRRPECSPA